MSRFISDPPCICTYLLRSFPMLTQIVQGSPPIGEPFPGHAYNSKWNVYPLARHIFPIQDDFPPTSIAFIGLPSRVIPFPLMEIQAATALHVFLHPESLDIESEKALVIKRRKLLEDMKGGDERAIAKQWHRLPEYEQFEYRTELLKFAGVTKWYVKPWHVEAYMAKATLRAEWR